MVGYPPQYPQDTVPEELRLALGHALDALHQPAEFLWAQAILLDRGGDDDQWMAGIRNGINYKGRTGVLVVTGAAIGYAEILDSGSQRWTSTTVGTEVTKIKHCPFVTSKFGYHAELTVHSVRGTHRFGLGWSADLDVLVSAVHEAAGQHPELDAHTPHPVRTDGVYVGGRTMADTPMAMVYSEDRFQVASFPFTQLIDLAELWWRVLKKQDLLTWSDLWPRDNGTFLIGEDAPVLLAPRSDAVYTTSATSYHSTVLSRPPYRRWEFVPFSVLMGFAYFKAADFWPENGHPVVRSGELVIDGHISRPGPVDTMAFLEDAVNNTIQWSRGLLNAEYFYNKFRLNPLAMVLEPGDKIDLVLPLRVEMPSSSYPVGPNPQYYVKPEGKLESGVAVVFQDRVAFLWTTGWRAKSGAMTLYFEQIDAVHPFAMRTTLFSLAAAEVLCRGYRFVIAFDDNLKYGSIGREWRDLLVRRITGHQPVFDGTNVSHWRQS